jgi:hypothetical protein
VESPPKKASVKYSAGDNKENYRMTAHKMHISCAHKSSGSNFASLFVRVFIVLFKDSSANSWVHGMGMGQRALKWSDDDAERKSILS